MVKGAKKTFLFFPMYVRLVKTLLLFVLTCYNDYSLSYMEEGQIEPLEKCLCAQHYNSVLINRISLFDTALVMTNTESFNSKSKTKTESKTDQKV